MQNVVEEIHNGINEIRNLLGPMNLKLENLDHKISETWIALQSKSSEFEAKLTANTIRISEQVIKTQEHSLQIARLLEQVQWMEQCLNVPKRPQKDLEKFDRGQKDLNA